MDTPNKKIVATFKERLVILEIMRQHIIKQEDSVLWEYEKGWSDDAVLSATNAKLKEEGTRQLNVLSVAYVRKEAFGNLYSVPKADMDARLVKAQDDIAALVKQVTSVVAMLAAAEKRIVTLELAYKHKGAR